MVLMFREKLQSETITRTGRIIIVILIVPLFPHIIILALHNNMSNLTNNSIHKFQTKKT